MSKITEEWSQLCQQLSSSLEQPNPQWLSQQSHSPVSDTLQRSPCLQHQLCLSIQQLRPAFHPQATFHSTPSSNPLWKRQAQSWRVQHPFQNTGAGYSSRCRAGTIRTALDVAVMRRQGEAEGSTKAVAASAQERLHCPAPASASTACSWRASQTTQPSHQSQGLQGTGCSYTDKKAETKKSCRNPAEPPWWKVVLWAQ